MVIKEVTVSGTVGKQVYATTVPVKLHGFLFRAGTGVTATVKIRDGNASGEVVIDTLIIPSNDSRDFHFCGPVRFDKGMHVKVIGSSAAVYLYVD